MDNNLHHHIVIVGGGTGGITVAARLKRAQKDLDVCIIEPSEKHYYQPMWTLVGAGVADRESTERDESDYIPKDVTWLKEAVATFQPEENALTTTTGTRVTYDYLVVSPGLTILWDAIEGLRDAIGKDGVCSNYDFRYVNSTWEAFQNTQEGNAIFTYPNTPIKCGGAPQKIMWLAHDHFSKAGIRDKVNIVYAAAGHRIFGVQKYREALETLVEERNIDTRWKHNLIAIHADKKEAVFEHLDTGEHITLPYAMIHVVPPMGSPEFVAQSPLANDKGWVDVDKGSLQHTTYPNVFSLGDASSLPTSKTGAAIRKQAPVLVENLFAVKAGNPTTATYNGYTSCPLVTAYGKLVLAEFDYDGNPAETFPFNQAKERRSMYALKKYILPRLYWNGMLRGRA